MSSIASSIASDEPMDWLLNDNDLLRFSTAGSVDDGKSTLIGRLLFDSKGVYEDQIASIRKASVNRNAGPIDFSLLTDGLRAEREQGITIDVAYRYFATPKRKFIIADTPGHEQYTRNMATGASTAQLAVVLVDARKGVLPQSRRHAYIASLLGIPYVVVAVNKMDLVDYSKQVFDDIKRDFLKFAEDLHIPHIEFIPISALEGDNVVRVSERTPWFEGPSLLEYLESVPVNADRTFSQFRFPVQYVIRPNLDFRGFAGQISSGKVKVGDSIVVLPSGHSSRVKSIATFDGDLEEAWAPMSVTITLEDEIDISRGDMLVHPRELPDVSEHFEATMVWMHSDALETGKSYLLKHSTQTVRANVTTILHKVDVNSMKRQEAMKLELNEIGGVRVVTQRPLYFDNYRSNRSTGAFILIDPLSNATVAAGMILHPVFDTLHDRGRVTELERMERLGHQSAVVWVGLRETVAHAVERILFDRSCLVTVLTAAPDAAVRKLLHSLGCITVVAAEPPSVDRSTLFPSDLPGDDDEAARQVVRYLEQRGILQLPAE